MGDLLRLGRDARGAARDADRRVAQHADPGGLRRPARLGAGPAAGRRRHLPQPLAALAGADLHRRVPGAAGRGDDPADRCRAGPARACRSGARTPTRWASWRCRSSPPRTSGRSSAPASSRWRPAQLEGAPGARLLLGRRDAAGDHPAGHPAGAAGLGQPAHRADQGLQPGLLPRPGGQPAGAVPDRAGLRGHHRQRVGAAAGGALLPGVDRSADARRQLDRPGGCAGRPAGPTAIPTEEDGGSRRDALPPPETHAATPATEGDRR